VIEGRVAVLVDVERWHGRSRPLHEKRDGKVTDLGQERRAAPASHNEAGSASLPPGFLPNGQTDEVQGAVSLSILSGCESRVSRAARNSYLDPSSAAWRQAPAREVNATKHSWLRPGATRVRIDKGRRPRDNPGPNAQ